MFEDGIVFDLYCSDCFVVLFNSRICVWEFSGSVIALIVCDNFFLKIC